ncbi:MAG: response regulator transcription factor [Polyangia bacterium]
MSSILVIEDEPDLQQVLEYNLTRAGHSVRCAGRGSDGLRLAQEQPPDLVLLDVMLPDLSGTQVCGALKADPRTKHVPVVMVSARGEEIDRIVGFELGADDYVVKPFSVRELLLRIQAVLRRAELHAGKPVAERTGERPTERTAERPAERPGERLGERPGERAVERSGERSVERSIERSVERSGERAPARDEAASEVLLCGPLRVDRAAHRVWVEEREIKLTALEFRLLVTLYDHKNRVLTRAQLLDEVWNIAAEITTRTVDTHVKRLREKLGAAGQLITTVRGVGYRFTEEALDAAPSAD